MNPARPAWLKLLTSEFERQRFDSIDYFARLAALPTAIVEDIMDQTLLPNSRELQRLAYAVTTDNDMRAMIIGEYNRAALGHTDVSPIPTDIQMLTNAINGLTAAITQTGISIPFRRRITRRFPRPGE